MDTKIEKAKKEASKAEIAAKKEVQSLAAKNKHAPPEPKNKPIGAGEELSDHELHILKDKAEDAKKAKEKAAKDGDAKKGDKKDDAKKDDAKADKKADGADKTPKKTELKDKVP